MNLGMFLLWCIFFIGFTILGCICLLIGKKTIEIFSKDKKLDKK